MAADVLQRIHPDIAKFAEAVLNSEGIGVCGELLKIVEPKSSLSFINPRIKKGSCDRFKVLVPYAGRTLKWEVLFNQTQPDFPPDFIFGPQDQEFVPNIEKIESLENWDSNNPESLVNLIKELIREYKEYQREQVEKIPRIHFEYTTLAADSSYPEFEVHVIKGQLNTDSIVNFMIKLPVDLTGIPPFIIRDCPGEDMACLFVSYTSLNGEHVTPTLLLSPRVERAFGGASNLRIPHWLGVNGCLLEYLPLIQELFAQKVEQVCQAFHKRREYVAAFLSAFGSSVLEYDAEGFMKLSLLFKVQGFFCIVHIELDKNFPQEAPLFYLQSIYHEKNNQPYEKLEAGYPYSPRWSGDEMAERARTFLLEKIPAFKDASLSNAKF
ncbi:BRISC and BRCA1-A complex member 2-like [Stylophora pistillata]|uniref:BRISC and BRCA1-A complex member 2 n=1 Tax=Stylophora pistillata TaxID=50429 RepID=A0A2B4RWG7_STYPI|nr:BRISC and BRCA1-A complex member 2-like [Stylophora pistillata]PFX20562.1 BRCA1-A complex subunit BRE [Stylophora pistillata]